MKQHRQRNGQEGIAMIIVVCIMAVLVMMSLALLHGLLSYDTKMRDE